MLNGSRNKMGFFHYKENRIWYDIRGNKGDYILLIHGNTVSSRIFNPLLKHFEKYFRLILVDLPGHGKSSRVDRFPENFFIENAKVLIALLDYLNLQKVHLLGTSGGAIIALNIALKIPDRVGKIIADSFPGERIIPGNIDVIEFDRERNLKRLLPKLYWKSMHGNDWKKVVEKDTKMLMNLRNNNTELFSGSLINLKAPVLLTGSSQDDLIPLLKNKYKQIEKKYPVFQSMIFRDGNHPSMLSNKKEFKNAAISFIRQ